MHQNIIRVSIGIQARSTSERLPGKISMDICGKTMLEWVIDSANECAFYLNRPRLSMPYRVSVTALMPYNDIAIPFFSKKVRVMEGPEDDVLARYVALAEAEQSDYVVRCTGDCALLPSYIITKAINTICHNRLDYVSNVDERLRLSADGFDVEVMSRRLLNYLAAEATEKKDREHVTTLFRRNQMQLKFKSGHLVGFIDLKGLKLSVDTEEDLERVREHKRAVLNAIYIAEQLSGRGSVHRL